ncbi:unnamed protein product, partial [Mesorhabditis spiculigera]
MCNLFLCLGRGRYKLIVVSQRDEELSRPTAEAQWRDGILGGTDLKDHARGTWFGVNKYGRVGILLSITQPKHTKKVGAPSRGAIVKDFLSASVLNANDFCEEIAEKATDYNGFQFVALNPEAAATYSMRTVTSMFVDEVTVRKWTPGVHVLGNCPPDRPFKKVKRGEKLWADGLDEALELPEDRNVAEKLLAIIDDRESCFPDHQLALQVGLPEDCPQLEPLSALRIVFPKGSGVDYGTRCYTVLLVRHDGSSYLLERRLVGEGLPIDAEHPKWDTVEHWFDVEQPH